MANKKLRSLEEAPVDVFESIKRALIHGGLIPTKHRASNSKPATTKSNIKQLKDLTTRSHDIIFQANTIFPFTPFPSTLTLDREKLTIANRFFFRTAKIASVPIGDILNVEANVGPFFGAVQIHTRYFASSPISVAFLSHKDALQIQNLLQGYIIAHERGIKGGNIDKDKLIAMLKDLGKGVSD